MSQGWEDELPRKPDNRFVKKQALAALPEAFPVRRERVAQDEEALKAQLYQQLGQLKVEPD